MNDKQFDGNWKAECLELRDEIAALKAERDAALVEFNQCSSVLDETERWVESLESEIITLKSALREAKNGLCNLDPVIQWLNNGCEVSEAVKELSVYEHLRCKTLATIDDALK
jgi:predicted RNase H-like nuclease (RuvC/YqgF family)